MIKYSFNNKYIDFLDEKKYLEFLTVLKKDEVYNFHQSIKGYFETPLVQSIDLANKLGLKNIYIKNEAERFGIKSFKGLGASYSIFKILKKKWEDKFNSPFTINDIWDDSKLRLLGPITFSAATDGNHGKAVAWFSNKINQNSIIYMPTNSAKFRIQAVENEGAKVVLIDRTYDDCVKKCKQDAEDNNWQEVSDTGYIGHVDNPRNVILGYTTLFREIEESCVEKLDYIFVPAGVGGLAAAASLYYKFYRKNSNIKLITVEPISSDCILESIKNGIPSYSKGEQDSIMAGLNCGFPSLTSWPILKNSVYLSIAISDDYVEEAIKQYHKEGIISGESGAAGLAGIKAILNYHDNKFISRLSLKNSNVLVINTEGDTDPINYKKILSNLSKL